MPFQLEPPSFLRPLERVPRWNQRGVHHGIIRPRKLTVVAAGSADGLVSELSGTTADVSAGKVVSFGAPVVASDDETAPASSTGRAVLVGAVVVVSGVDIARFSRW